MSRRAVTRRRAAVPISPVGASSASSRATWSRARPPCSAPRRRSSGRRPRQPARSSIRRPTPSRKRRSRSPPPTGFRAAFREADGVLYVIDQRKLPDSLEEFPVKSAAMAAATIREMIVRGAPAIGQVAAIGMALTAKANVNTRPYARRATLRGAANVLRNSRPTAVNLGWAVDRVMAAYEAIGELSEDGEAIAAAIRGEADTIVFETTEDHGRIATFGLEALDFPEDRPLRILTHCNTGPLACGQFGTALGIVQAAHHAGREPCTSGSTRRGRTSRVRG